MGNNLLVHPVRFRSVGLLLVGNHQFLHMHKGQGCDNHSYNLVFVIYESVFSRSICRKITQTVGSTKS